MRQPRSALRRALSVLMAVAMVAAMVSAGVGPAIALTVNRLAAAVAAPAAVTTTFASSTQFDMTGFLQTATLDPACVAAAGANLDPQGHPAVAHCGGTLMVNGHIVVVPAETVVILPASALTWQELFAQSPAPYTGVATGMALDDVPDALYDLRVQRHRQPGDRWRPGPLHRRAGPRLPAGPERGRRVHQLHRLHHRRHSRSAGSSACPEPARSSGSTTRSRCRDGHPEHRSVHAWGGHSPDVRFQVDQDNPTILSATGFPMCIPRVPADPNIAGNADDPLCPLANRPISVGGPDPITGQQHPPAGRVRLLLHDERPRALVFPDPDDPGAHGGW